MTLGTYDDAYGAASITFMLQWTKTLSQHIESITTMEEKDGSCIIKTFYQKNMVTLMKI